MEKVPTFTFDKTIFRSSQIYFDSGKNLLFLTITFCLLLLITNPLSATAQSYGGSSGGGYGNSSGGSGMGRGLGQGMGMNGNRGGNGQYYGAIQANIDNKLFSNNK